MSIINMGNISEPAKVLVEKISNAIEGLAKPFQIKRIAKAEAEAGIIEAKSQIEITELQRRAFIRFLNEEGKKQENIENITGKAIIHLSDSSHPQDMEDDWITNFFDKCRIVADDEMQLLWAKVLAGEANSPGTYSKRTVNFLGSLDKSEAELFTTVCSFVWSYEGIATPFVYDTDASIYKDQGINFGSLTHLDDIGLIDFSSFGGYSRLELPQRVVMSYFETTLTLEFKKPEDNELQLGKVILTGIGSQLVNICGSKPIDGFYDYVTERWTKEGLAITTLRTHKGV